MPRGIPLAAVLAFCAPLAQAQFPAKTLRLVVAWRSTSREDGAEIPVRGPAAAKLM